MSVMFRVVLTCWDYGVPKPYADDLSGVKLSLSQQISEAANRKTAPIITEGKIPDKSHEI